MKTHNIILLILLFVCTNVLTSVLLAQDKEVNMVSKKAKLKTIKYKKYNYTAVGYVYKDRFVEGQKLSFIKTQTGDTIISGIYSINYGYPCIKGNYKGFVRMNNEVTSGLFIISNSIKTNQLIPVRKNVGKLKIRTLDILEHKDTYAEKYPLVFRKTSTNRYELKILFDDKTLEVVISPDTIKKYGFYAFDTFIENSKNVNLLYKNGDIYTTPDRPYENASKEIVNQKGRVIDLVFPIVVLIICCIIGMIWSGGFFEGDDFITAFSNSDASVGLAVGSFFALIISIVFYLVRRVLNFADCMSCLPEGFKAMVPAILILTMAWTLKAMTDSLGAAEFVANAMQHAAGGLMSLLPAIIFLVGCFLAFATGTSWGTFGILISIVVAVFQGTNEIRTPYGVYIWIKRTGANNPDAPTIAVKVKGAYAAPDYIQGETDADEWIQKINETTVPWIELRGEQMAFSVPVK